ncbi:MAG TPA: PaaI family thioesterase [Burkholderiaceae bacterium]|nr:PaaI family thioesterase [Burkholderiaceae bacterium]
MHRPPIAPFVTHLGIRFLEADAGAARTQVHLEPHHLNRGGVAHGGLIATLLDTTMSRAAAHAGGTARPFVTVEMKVAFMSAGRGALRSDARCVHRTTTLAFCEGEVRDEADRLVATGSATFKFARNRTTQGAQADGAD